MRTSKYSSWLRQIFISVGLAVLVSGCATGLSKHECRIADWRSVGYEDGILGRSAARIGQHREACAKYGVGLDFDAYRSGWDEGVRRYCQAGNAYREGRQGKSYNGICPADMETQFLQAYREGRQLYKAETDIRRTARKLKHKRQRLANIEVAMRDTGVELVSPGVITERRIILVDELRRLGDERAAIQAQIPRLEAELQGHKKRLATLDSDQDY